jgi:uncharacterized protein
MKIDSINHLQSIKEVKMSVDVHTHPHRRSIKETVGNYDNYNVEEELLPDGTFKDGFVEQYLADMATVDKAIVLAVDAPYWIAASNKFIAAFAKACGDKVIGFASVNPNSKTAVQDLEFAVRELGLQGIKLSPIYQNFVPDSQEVYPLYKMISNLGIPIIWHQATSMIAQFGPLEAAQPIRLDKVLRDFPEIRMVFSHMSVPWAWEAISMAHKHPNLYIDVSAMAGSTWFMYNALVAAKEWGCMHKIIFGSDYPWYTPAETCEYLYALSDLTKGTRFPELPLDILQGIYHQDTLKHLGI